jgi:hypothetical protein
MKYLLFFALLNILSYRGHSQERDSIFAVFFKSGFKNDSLHVFLNNKKIMSANLNTDLSTGQCSDLTGFIISDSLQCLTLIEVASNNKFKTVVKKGTKYLYIYKLGKDGYEFDYSNRLSLPE